MTESDLAKIEEQWNLWEAEGVTASVAQGVNDIGLLGRALRESWAENKRLSVASEKLSEPLEAEIDWLCDEWYDAARHRSRLACMCMLRRDLRKFAWMAEAQRDKYWHEQLLSAGKNVEQIVEEELGACR